MIVERQGGIKMGVCKLCEQTIEVDSEQLHTDEKGFTYCEKCIDGFKNVSKNGNQNSLEKCQQVCSECGEPFSLEDSAANRKIHQKCMSKTETTIKSDSGDKDTGLNNNDVLLLDCCFCGKKVTEENVIWKGDDPFHPDCYRLQQGSKENINLKENDEKCSSVNKSEYKDCPFCAEEIKAIAIYCRFCQTYLDEKTDKNSKGNNAANINKEPKVDWKERINKTAMEVTDVAKKEIDTVKKSEFADKVKKTTSSLSEKAKMELEKLKVPVGGNEQNSYSIADELLKLKQCLDAEIITQEEFEQQKAKLLNK